MDQGKYLSKALRFVKVARAIAEEFSKDNRCKVGAVALDDNLNIIATGWNGFPRGVDDTVEERHVKPAKLLWTSHAEENLVAQSAYSGHRLKNATVVVSARYPCATCARMLIQAGVRRVICPPVGHQTWLEQNTVAQTMFNEAGVEVVPLPEGQYDFE